MRRACSQNGGRYECFQNLQVNLQERPLGRPRHRWDNNIRIDFEEIGINTGNWVDSAHDRKYWRALVISALNLRVP